MFDNSENLKEVNLILIDIGNTFTRIGFCIKDSIKNAVDIPTHPVGVLTEKFALELEKYDRYSFSGAVIASVVPGADICILQNLQKLKLPFIQVDHNHTGGVRLKVKEPSSVGADRIANAAGVFHNYKKGAIVADLGTANTFDIITPKGEYLGGVIAPGAGAVSEALSVRASKLEKVEFLRPDKIIGNDTVSALASGLFFTIKGQVLEIFRVLEKEVPESYIKIITGGTSPLIKSEFSEEYINDRNLTLKGLLSIWLNKAADSSL